MKVEFYGKYQTMMRSRHTAMRRKESEVVNDKTKEIAPPVFYYYKQCLEPSKDFKNKIYAC